MNPAKFSFPAVKGIQANMEYYVTMVPLDYSHSVMRICRRRCDHRER